MEASPLIDLIRHFETFQKETKNNNLTDFSVWLNKILNSDAVKADGDINRTLVWLIHRLAKFFKWYAKNTLSKHGLVSMDEYFILIAIEKLGNPSKTEVYSSTISEINTGTQMLNRLRMAGMVKENIDSVDKRVRRVQITPKGKKAKDGFFRDSESDLKLKAGNLPPDEKIVLIEHLQYLEKFHSGIYFSDKN
jgi:DNA-binding MarR family transcriptional regulator